MKYIFSLILLISVIRLNSQILNQIENLKILNASVSKIDTIIDNICGQSVKAVRLTILSKTKVETKCYRGTPKPDAFDSIKNKVFIYYAYDSNKLIQNAVLNEIFKYVEEQEIVAKQYQMGNDFSNLPFEKSFYINEEMIIPFISSGGSRIGDYKIFYFNNIVYKIVQAEKCKGFGCLSFFVNQNIYFIKDGKKLDLGKYIKNTEIVRQILNRK